jgi:hypothetical protein
MLALVTVVELGEFPHSSVNGGIALALPIVDIERAVHVADVTEAFHHERESRSCRSVTCGFLLISAWISLTHGHSSDGCTAFKAGEVTHQS